MSTTGCAALLDLLCLHMVRHIFLIIAQVLPETGQPETQIAVRLMRLGCAAAIGGSLLESPSRLSGVHALNEGREEGGIMVVDQRYVVMEGFLVLIRTLCSSPGLGPDLLVRLVLRNQVLKLESQQ